MSTGRPEFCGEMGSVCIVIEESGLEGLYQHFHGPPLFVLSRQVPHISGDLGFVEEQHQVSFPARERPVIYWGLAG